jgi:hypothetical protein
MADVPREQAALERSSEIASEPDPGSVPAAAIVDLDAVRLRSLLPELISRCMAYAAQPAFDDALVAGVEAFYGVDVDVATAENEVLEDPLERVRFFPWLLWDRPVVAGDPRDTIGQRFAREGELGGGEARLLAALNQACVWFWQVAATGPARVELVALGSGRRVAVRDRALAAEVTAGEVLHARVVTLDARSQPAFGLIDAIHATLPATLLPTLSQALEPFVTVSGPGGRARTLDVARVRDATPALFDLVARLLADLSAEPAPPPPLMTLHLAPSEAAGLRVHLGGARPTWQVDEAIVAAVAWQASGAARLHAIGEDAADRLKSRLGELGLRVSPLEATESLERAVQTGWAHARFPRWMAHLPPLVSHLAQRLDALVAAFPETVLPGLGRTPTDALRDAWGQRDLTRHLDALSATLPTGHAEVEGLRRRLGLGA